MDAYWWTAPRIWPDEIAYIIGGGSSLSGFDFTPLHDQRVIGCNDAYCLGSWVDVCLFGDWGWWLRHWKQEIDVQGRQHEGLQRFPGLIVTCCMRAELFQVPRIKKMQRRRRGVKHPPHILSWYENTGAAAIRLATLFGAKKIILLGFDMSNVNGKNNWHVNLKDAHCKPIVRRRHLEGMDWLYEDMEGAKLNVEILNANPDSALETFKKVEWEKVKP
jgi:hypothetical protein